MRRAILATLILTSCGSLGSGIWFREGATQAEFYRDRTYCVETLPTKHQDAHVGADFLMDRDIEKCLRGLGWIQQPGAEREEFLGHRPSRSMPPGHVESPAR